MRLRLLGHVQRLVVSPLLREETDFDTEASEPYAGETYGPAILVPVQLDPTRAGGRAPGQGGARVSSAYTATARSVDLTALGYTPKDGDRVSEILEPRQIAGGGMAVELYVVRCRPSARTHYGAESWVIELGDRSPARSPSEATP